VWNRLRALEPLRQNRNFAAVWGSELISTLGDRVHHVALAALVFQLTGSLTLTGLALVFTALPDLLLGLFAGVIVDRLDRRLVMAVTDFARVPLVALVPILAYQALWLAFADLFVVNTLSIINRPAATAILPSIVPADQLKSANSLSSVSQNTSDIVGYPLAAAIIGFFAGWLGSRGGLQAAFAFDALTFLVSGLLVLTVKTSVAERALSGLRSVRAEMVEGIQFVWSSPVVRANTLVMLLGPLTLGATTPLFVGYAWNILGGGQWEYAMLGTGISAGSIIGGLWLGSDDRLPAGILVVAGLAVMGVGIMATSLVSNIWFAVGTIAIAGVGSMMVLIPSVTLVQLFTPEHLLGRVFAVRATLIFAAIIISNAVGGWAGQQFGVRQSFFGCGALLFIFTVIASLIPSVRSVGMATNNEPQPGFSD
jgi:MFS family permease